MTQTVTVGCRMQNGVTLSVHRFDEHVGRMRDIGTIELEGPRLRDHGPDSQAARFTHGVDKELWDAWLAQNKINSLYTSGAIFLLEPESKAA